MIHYKGFNHQMKCMSMQYEIWKTYEMEGEVKLCERGFHSSLLPINCFRFYSVVGSIFCKVEVEPIISDRYKSVSNKITILEKVSVEDMIYKSLEMLKNNPEKYEVEKSSSYYGRIINTSEDKILLTLDDNSRIMSIGNSVIAISLQIYSDIMSNGDFTSLISLGNFSRITSDSKYSNIFSKGRNTKIISTGVSTRIQSEGDFSNITVTNDYQKIISTGNKSTINAIGNNIYLNCVKGTIINLSDKCIHITESKSDKWMTIYNGELIEGIN